MPPDAVQCPTMEAVHERKWIEPNASAVVAALAAAGIEIDTSDVTLLPRDDRFVARLPDDRIAWFPTNASGAERLEREARVLALLARHCRFRVPIVAHHMPSGWQLRRSVPGRVDPFSTYHNVRADRGFASAVGEAMGRVLADQHRNVPPAELEGWLPRRPAWPAPKASIERDLACVTDDRQLIARALQLIDRYEDAEATVADRVLAHTDFGFHNVVVDPTGGEVVGVFDYDDAAFADYHHDFKYLLLDIEDEALLRSAVDAYRAAGGSPIDGGRVRLLNAASAIGFLAFRADSRPDERPAGRTLTEDLRWTRLALDRAGG
jgi:aminoglycoside phosphotransferase (APT) family kinase protein